jgi:hypothetical protein
VQVQGRHRLAATIPGADTERRTPFRTACGRKGGHHQRSRQAPPRPRRPGSHPDTAPHRHRTDSQQPERPANSSQRRHRTRPVNVTPHDHGLFVPNCAPGDRCRSGVWARSSDAAARLLSAGWLLYFAAVRDPGLEPDQGLLSVSQRIEHWISRVVRLLDATYTLALVHIACDTAETVYVSAGMREV